MLVVVRDACVCVSPDNNIDFVLSMVWDNCNRDNGEDKGFVGQVATSTNSPSTSPTTSSPTSPPTLAHIDPATFPSPNPSVLLFPAGSGDSSLFRIFDYTLLVNGGSWTK